MYWFWQVFCCPKFSRENLKFPQVVIFSFASLLQSRIDAGSPGMLGVPINLFCKLLLNLISKFAENWIDNKKIRRFTLVHELHYAQSEHNQDKMPNKFLETLVCIVKKLSWLSLKRHTFRFYSSFFLRTQALRLWVTLPILHLLQSKLKLEHLLSQEVKVQ